MHTIRIRKAVSGNTFKFKFRFMEEKRDLTLSEARDFAENKKATFEPSKNLSDNDFTLGKLTLTKNVPKSEAPMRKIRKGDRKTSIPRTTVREAVAVVQKPARMLRPGTFDVHSRVGSQGILEGEQLILTELRKASKHLTASEVGKRIFKNELTKKGIEFVVEIRGFKFYAYLNKHYTPMIRKKLVKVVGQAKGHRKMEKLWEAISE